MTPTLDRRMIVRAILGLALVAVGWFMVSSVLASTADAAAAASETAATSAGSSLE